MKSQLPPSPAKAYSAFPAAAASSVTAYTSLKLRLSHQMPTSGLTRRLAREKEAITMPYSFARPWRESEGSTSFK